MRTLRGIDLPGTGEAGPVRAREPRPARSPRVVAHRGSSLTFPEHTRAAYRRALDEGADGLECDIRLSRDLVPVLMHDGRLDATTSGSGPLGERTADELDELQVHARPERGQGPRQHRQHRRHRQHGRRGAGAGAAEVDPPVDGGSWSEAGVLRLRDFLALAAAAGRPVELALETKHPARAGRHVEGAVVAALAEHPELVSGVRVMSFAAGALRRLRAIDPRLPTVLLLSDAHAGQRSAVLPAWVDIAGPSIRQVRRDPGLVDRLHEQGHEVHVWTVDADADLARCVDLGVDVVISNRPGALLRLLGR